jgi:rhodanese-related sulfurtransferase
MPSKNPSRPQSPQRPIPIWWIVAGIIILIAAVALIYFLSLRSTTLTQSPTLTPTLTADISVDDAFVVFGDKNVLFLDVRPASDWKAYRIDKSVNIPVSELSGRLSELPRTGAIIIIDALGGEQAAKAYDILKQAGFTSVSWVKGGIEAWVLRRYPLIGTAPY